MKKAIVCVDNRVCGFFIELEKGRRYEFYYEENYNGPQVSLTMPTKQKIYRFDRFPSFFEGFLPEGIMLEALLRKAKIDRDDLFEQLIRVGQELVGNITVKKDASLSNHI